MKKSEKQKEDRISSEKRRDISHKVETVLARQDKKREEVLWLVLQGEESDITDKGTESSAMVRVMLFSSLSQDQTPQVEVSADCTLLLSYSERTLLKFIPTSDITERGSLMCGEKKYCWAT